MIVQTRNTTYTLTRNGDGVFLISGHPTYCPSPVLAKLLGPVTIGEGMWFVTDAHPKPIRTSRVLSITQEIGAVDR
jgi:hypothetical protein